MEEGKKAGFGTLAIHAGQKPDPVTGSGRWPAWTAAVSKRIAGSPPPPRRLPRFIAPCARRDIR